MAYDLKS